MPVVDLRTNVELTDSARDELRRQLVRVVSRVLDRPPSTVMVALERRELFLDDSTAPTALLELRLIDGVAHEIKRAVCRELFVALREALRVPPERAYLHVIDVPPAAAWRFNGEDAVCVREQPRASGTME